MYSAFITMRIGNHVHTLNSGLKFFPSSYKSKLLNGLICGVVAEEDVAQW